MILSSLMIKLLEFTVGELISEVCGRECYNSQLGGNLVNGITCNKLETSIFNSLSLSLTQITKDTLHMYKC